MCRLLWIIVTAIVFQYTHSFILDNNQDCPTNCTCSETGVACQPNTLREWPVALQNADFLEILILANNSHLGNIPHGAFDSFQYSLTYLYLDNIGLTQVPPDIKHLHKLTELDMSNNAIGDRGFPDDAFGIGPMPIANLDLQNTSLTKMPLALCSLSSLLSLHMDKNDIKMISDEQANCIRNVSDLHITDCAMSKIPSSLRLLTNLNHLYLSGNPLRSIEHFDLYGLTYLEWLWVDNASISYISPGAFQWTPSLQGLALNHNNITNIPDAFKPYNRTQLIDLSDNPVHCSCGLRWASDWMRILGLMVYGTCENHAVSISTYIKTFLPRCPS